MVTSQQTETLYLPDRGTRREHQKYLARRKRRIRRRRRSRIRRVQFWRMLYTTRFWTRASVVLALCLAAVFWAKFAYVYDIPNSAQANQLGHMNAYVTVKDWWFGPTVFNLDAYQSYPIPSDLSSNPYVVLLDNLGRYKTIVEMPKYIWVGHAAS